MSRTTSKKLLTTQLAIWLRDQVKNIDKSQSVEFSNLPPGRQEQYMELARRLLTNPPPPLYVRKK